MRRRWLAAVALGLLVAGALLWHQAATDAPRQPGFLPEVAPPMAAPAYGGSIPLAALGDPTVSPERKVRRIYELLQNYAMAMKSRSRTPLATNAEITRALGGENILRVVFLPRDHPSVSPSGELLDPWQTPYFFHALAADSWEVVSAGPDRIAFTADDLVYPPGGGVNSLRRGGATNGR